MSIIHNSSFGYQRRQTRRRPEINITNLMDVMMVLLVVFMVAAPLMTSGIELDLPKVGGKNMEGKETSINISVDKEGYYYIGENVVEDDEVYQIMYNPSLQFDVRSEGKLGERYGYDRNNKLTYIGFSSHRSDRIDDHKDKQ